jgi:ABC-type polysaccharide/polyol phosphate transport system ATPase subunit
MTPALSIKGVGKRYKTFSNRREQLKSILGLGKKGDHEFWALKDIDLEVEPGTTLGILGRNGAGKSTLLKIISGVSQPTTGTVEVNGRMAAIFGVGAGFNPEFTGRENVMLNGLILGIDYGEIQARFDDIAAFADIGEFMDLPVRTYSSGMRSRLGFAVAVNVEPEVLVIDEALSAGDQAFKKKAIQRMYDLRDSGTTVLFVSHSMGMVKKFCTDAILIHQGQLIASGTPDEVADQYQEIVSSAQAKYSRSTKQDAELDEMLDHEEEEDLAGVSRKETPVSESRERQGTGEARIHALELLDESGNAVDTANKLPSGSTLTARIHLEYAEALEDSALEFTLYSKRAKVEVFSTDTERQETPLGRKSEGDRVIVDFTLETPLKAGPYVATVIAYDPQVEESYLDQAESTFKITRPEDDHPVRGLVDLPATVEVHALERRQSPSRFT